MNSYFPNIESIFTISGEDEFEQLALEIFRYQAFNNPVYHEFIKNLSIDPKDVQQVDDIPFLPIEFFKSKKILTGSGESQLIFKSSGTTDQQRSHHYVVAPELYRRSFIQTFRSFYGDPHSFIILALLPSYVEQGHSSLVYMTQELIELTGSKDSGFYMGNTNELAQKIEELSLKKNKIILLGVSYALLDFSQKHRVNMNGQIVMETGGMKGRKKEMIREELHAILKSNFNLNSIHSEYGMTELLSQAYSKGDGWFSSPPWMKILTREVNDPFTIVTGKTGGINIIDLANLHSCSFIATMDLGKVLPDGRFNVLGRFDNSEMRGCNLMI